MQFDFAARPGSANPTSGYLAFTPATGGGAAPLLLVTDAGHDSVHLVDVVHECHMGYLAAPGLISGPRGVAVSESSPLAAVTAWKSGGSGDHVVHLYSGAGVTWERVRVIGGGFGRPGAADGQLQQPFGLQFSADSSSICVADSLAGRVSLFRVGDGVFERQVATGLRYPMDVLLVDGGWLVACSRSHCVSFVSDGSKMGGGSGAGLGSGDAGGVSSLGTAGRRGGEMHYPSALALVPGLGLVVREDDGARLQVFTTATALEELR